MESSVNPDDQSERIKSESLDDNRKNEPVKASPSQEKAAGDKPAAVKAPPATAAVKQQQRREGQNRRKDDKSVEHVLRALNSLNTPEEKLAAMCKKYADLVNDQRAMQNAARVAEKRIAVLQRDKEQLQVEQSKAVLVRGKLESLCRELQRQNKAIKDESMMRVREEEERRKEVSAKFQATLNEITDMMKQNSDKNTKLRDDNIDMTAKLKSVCQEFEKRELHVEQLVKQFQLEVQLADAKLAKAKMEMSSERETLLREKQQLLMEVVDYKTRLEQMQESELQLKNQMTIYNEKYEEFHKALIQSNQVISGFKTEIDKMSKQIRKLEKETCAWKTKYDETHTALLRMTDERVRGDEALERANKRVATLHNLCRTLQAQVVEMRNAAKNTNTSIPAKVESNACNCPCDNWNSDVTSTVVPKENTGSSTAVSSPSSPSVVTLPADFMPLSAAEKLMNHCDTGTKENTGSSTTVKNQVSSPSVVSSSDDFVPLSTLDKIIKQLHSDSESPTIVKSTVTKHRGLPNPADFIAKAGIETCECLFNYQNQVVPTEPLRLHEAANNLPSAENDSGGGTPQENYGNQGTNCNHNVSQSNDTVSNDAKIIMSNNIEKTETNSSPLSNQNENAVTSPQNKSKSSTPSGKASKISSGKKSKSKSGSGANACNSAQADIKSLSQKMSQASLT